MLCKIPAYFGDGNKIRRATQSSPSQREELPKKSKVLLLYFFSALPKSQQHSSAWKFRTDEGAASGTPIRTMNGRCGQGPCTSSRSLSACKKQKMARKKMRHEMVKQAQHAMRKGAFPTKNKRKRDAFHFRESLGKSKLKVRRRTLPLLLCLKPSLKCPSNLGESFKN